MSSAKEVMEGFKQAKSDRTVVESTWEDIVYYTNPRKRGVTTETTPGEKTPTDIYDGTAPQSNIVLAAGLSGFLTNSSQRWFELEPRDRKFIDGSDEKIWFGEVTKVMYNTLAESNFYHQIHEAYLDFGPFGTAIFYCEEDPLEDVRFYARHPKEAFLVENEREIVDKLYRSFDMTAYASYQKFGAENVPEEIRKAVEEKNDFTKKFKFIHYVGKRSKRDVTKSDALNKPFESIWIAECNKEKKVFEGGYDEFPYFVPRFYKNSCEVYGYGPGHIIYPDIAMINDLTKIYYESAEIALFPPSMVEYDGMVGTLDYRAKALNYQRQSLNKGLAVQPLLNGASVPVGLDFINRVEQKVEKAFFVDLFLALRQTKRMTATEVMEVSQERMFMLGPVLGRLQSELLNPVLSRVFNILLRRGKFPQAPQSLQNVDYDITYVSPLARSQRSMQARDMQTFLMEVGQIAQIDPAVVDIIDGDEVVRELHSMHSVSPSVVKGQDDVDGIREQRAAQQQAQAQMMAMQQSADIAKSAGSATKDFTNARTEE